MILTYEVTPKLSVGRELIIPVMLKNNYEQIYNFDFYNTTSYISVSFKYNKKYIARLFENNRYAGEQDYYIKIKPNNYNKFVKLSLEDLQKWFDYV